MGEYTVGIILLFLLWLIFFIPQPGSRKKIMLFTGFLYTVVLIPTFWLHKLILYFFPVSPLYNPGYWHDVTTIFNLNNRTGGFSIEDVLFMILWGGLAGIMSIWLSKKSVTNSSKTTYLPIVVFEVVYLVLLPTRINPIYLLIIPSFAGGLSTLLGRRDLILNSWLSGLSFTVLYILCFSIFNLLFPYFIPEHYNLKELSNLFVLGVPLEDVFYAFTFGFMWGPIYKVIKA
jgi:hypothetical protein